MRFLVQFGAVCGVLCGLFIGVPGAVEAVTGETAATSVVLAVSPALAVPLLTALHLRQMSAAGRLGEVGFAVNLLGLGLFGGAAYTLNVALFFVAGEVVDELATTTRLMLLGSALVFVAGSLLFGIAMIRARVHPRVPAWAFAIGLPAFAIASTLPESLLNSALHMLVGAALIWLGAGLRAADPAPVPAGAGRP